MNTYHAQIVLTTVEPVAQGGPGRRTVLNDANKEAKIIEVQHVIVMRPKEESEHTGTGEDGDPEKYRPYTIPIISANAFRHRLRSILADHLLEATGLTYQDFIPEQRRRINYHTLYSGGGLGSAAAGNDAAGKPPRPVDAIYADWPILALLGGSYGTIYAGKVRVSLGQPLVHALATQWFPTREDAYRVFPESTWITASLTDLIRGRRLNDAWLEVRHPDRRVPTDEGTGEKDSTRAMPVSREYIPVGVPFGTRVTLYAGTDREAAALRYALETLASHGVIVMGGRTNAGMGGMAVSLSDVSAFPDPAIYTEWVKAHAEPLRQALLGEGPFKKNMLEHPIG